MRWPIFQRRRTPRAHSGYPEYEYPLEGRQNGPYAAKQAIMDSPLHALPQELIR
jgi:hypothetical protein